MTDLIPLKCPSCGANIKVREGATLAVCGYCGSQHILTSAAKTGTTPTPFPSAKESSDAPIRPDLLIRPRLRADTRMQVESDSQKLRITRRWFTPSTIALAFFAVIWDAFLLFWYSVAFTSGAPLMMLVFPLLHVTVGVVLTYTVLCGFFNRTIVELTREQLEVWFEPLPWPGEKTIPTAQIKQLYCKERVTRTKSGLRYSYQLCAVKQDDEEIVLLKGLNQPDSAAFYEQEIERWLRIEDCPVLGEYGK